MSPVACCLALLALPVILSGLGWIGWKLLQSRMIGCAACVLPRAECVG